MLRCCQVHLSSQYPGFVAHTLHAKLLRSGCVFFVNSHWQGIYYMQNFLGLHGKGYIHTSPVQCIRMSYHNPPAAILFAQVLISFCCQYTYKSIYVGHNRGKSKAVQGGKKSIGRDSFAHAQTVCKLCGRSQSTRLQSGQDTENWERTTRRYRKR